MTIGRALRSLPGKLPLGGVLVILAASLLGTQQVSAQTCQPEKLYDIIVGNFHQSVAQRTDGSWSGWGQNMKPPADPELSPADLQGYLASVTPSAGTILLTSTASNRTGNYDAVALTTEGLYVWGDQTGVFQGLVPGSGSVRKLTQGLPAGVQPQDVTTLFLVHKAIALVAKGHVYMLVNSTGGPGINMAGGGPTAVINQWQQVQTPDGQPLADVIAVRGQVASASQAAMMALTSNGDAYTWGRTTLLGDGTAMSSVRNYATKMQLPHQGASPLITGSLPKQIGVTGNGQTAPSVSTVNTYFVLYGNGELFSMGANNANQLGDHTISTATTTLVWGNVKRPDGVKFTNVDMFSVQEHDTSYAAGALITTGKDLYNWGNNNYNMLGRPTSKVAGVDMDSGCAGSGNSSVCTMGMPTGFQMQGSASPTNARYIEMGGHTMVFLRDRSAKFCYVGHKTEGSMGDGTTDSDGAFPTFTCDATPNLNVCGSTGYDYGDAPRVYEAGGGSNLAMHFYVSQEADLYLGAQPPVANDATPKSVIIGTSNVGVRGDYTAPTYEEEAVGGAGTGGMSLTVTEGATSFSTPVTFHNTTGKAATLYAWVDWNNDGKFAVGEGVQISSIPGNGTVTSGTLQWTGLSGLTPGQRYMRLRLTTDNLALPTRAPTADVNGVDRLSLGFAGDGEMEDHSVWVVPQGGQPDNVPPVAVDVTSAPVGVDGQLQTLVLPGAGGNALLNGEDTTPGTVVSYVIKTLPSNGTLRYHDGSQWRDATVGLEIEAAWVLGYYSTSTATDSFTFQAIDNDGAYSSEHKTGIGATAANGDGVYTIPKAYVTAVNDTGSGAPGTAINTTVGGNDTATGGTVGAITSKTDGANGTVNCSGSGATASCTYTPSGGYTGTDSYTYTICMAAPYTAVCQTATVNVTVSPPNIDMAVEVTVPATPVPYGSTQTVTAVCTNNGNANATGATCGIDAPGSGTLTLQSCSPASPSALAPAGTITCTYEYVTPGPGTPPVGLTGRTSASNETAGNSANNTQTKTLAVSGPDVFAKIQSPATANPGDQVTTLVTFGNQGDQPADGVTYEVTNLPPDLDGVQCTGATCDYDPATGKVAITGLPTTLAGGQQNQVALKWKTPAATANYTLTATTATTTANDPLPNNTADAPLAVGVGQSVAEVTTAVQVPATAGTNQPVNGKVTYTNIGSVTATGVTYNVALDGGVTPTVSYQGAPCTVAGDGTLSGCNLPTVLLQGESLELAVSYPAPATAGQQRTVTSTVGATNDGDSANNQATGQTAAQATAPSTTPDVTTTVAPPAKVTPGKTVKVPVTFTNISPTTPATGVTYTLTLPDGTQDVACTLPTTCTVTGGSGSDVVVTVNSLPTSLQPGQSVPMELTYTAPASGSVQITSRVAAPGASGNPAELPADQGNNAAVAASAVNAAPGPDMAIDVTTLPPTVVPGVPYEGSFTCTNLSATDAATNATCTVTGLPTNVTTQSCTIDGAPWAQPGTVPAGKQVVCTVGGTPPIGNTTTDTNVKGTTGSDGDTDPGNNISDQPVRVEYPDMSIDLSGLPGSAIVGKLYEGSFICTNTTANPAPADAATVCAVTSLPAGISMGACAIGGTTWNQGEAVPAGATILCQVSGTPTGGGSTVQGDTNTPGDSNNGNNQRTKAITVTAAPDLAAGPIGGTLPPGTLGKPYTGGFTCSNQGSADATGAACDITGLPSGLNKGACTIDTAVPAPGWSNGDTIPMGATVTCAITGTPTAATPGPVTTTVTTSTTSAPGDSNLGDNTQSPTITIAAVSPTGIPTLSQWGLLALSGLLAFLGMARRRRV